MAWQALLKTATKYCGHEVRQKDRKLCPDKFWLELLTDTDMLLMIEKGIRGGITQAVKRYAKANNKYMNGLYNPDEVSIFPQYVEINNEYGWSMLII